MHHIHITIQADLPPFPSMLSSLVPDVNPQRQDNNSMPLQPISNNTSSSGLKPIPTNNQQQRLEPSGFKDICPIPTTRSTSRSLSPSIDKSNKAIKPVSSFLCVFLHIFLVLLHLILLALHVSGVEHRLTTSESGEWMTVLSASTQAFYAVRVALLFKLDSPLTLTRKVVLHDTHLPDATPDAFQELDPTAPKIGHSARQC
jgi:hypothetical protein